jgi:hypothetical protein
LRDGGNAYERTVIVGTATGNQSPMDRNLNTIDCALTAWGPEAALRHVSRSSRSLRVRGRYLFALRILRRSRSKRDVLREQTWQL